MAVQNQLAQEPAADLDAQLEVEPGGAEPVVTPDAPAVPAAPAFDPNQLTAAQAEEVANRFGYARQPAIQPAAAPVVVQPVKSAIEIAEGQRAEDEAQGIVRNDSYYTYLAMDIQGQRHAAELESVRRDVQIGRAVPLVQQQLTAKGIQMDPSVISEVQRGVAERMIGAPADEQANVTRLLLMGLAVENGTYKPDVAPAPAAATPFKNPAAEPTTAPRTRATAYTDSDITVSQSLFKNFSGPGEQYHGMTLEQARADMRKNGTI